ncbi:acyclic terpene utilization AtuA family protein [Rugosimonospora acidiphila]
MLTGGELDVLTGDYLAELTMLILGRDRARDSSLGYARTFLSQMRACLGEALDRGVTIVVNAGGLNPAGLAAALTELAGTLGRPASIGYVTGDALDRPGALAANAYLGAFGIAECLRGGANIVVTGRVTDASLVVGPAIARYGWERTDFDRLAGATVAGHILECGTQATGGNFAFFTELADPLHPGFPIAEIEQDGSCVITKHRGTGGAVTVETVTAQLLYEIDSPDYLGPDVVTRFDSIRLTGTGPDRVSVGGVRGGPPPETLKVGVSSLGGFRNSMTFVLTGLDIDAKAALVRDQLTEAVGPDGLEFDLARTDHADPETTETASALLHVHLRDGDPKRAGRAFSQAVVELALGSYPGCTLTTPPGDAVPYGVFATELVAQRSVEHTAVLPDGGRVPIAAPPVMATPPARLSDPGARPRPTNKTTLRVPFGTVFGARSGDKGGDANVGVWARNDSRYEWLREFLTADRIRELLPETANLPIDRYELPNLRAVNLVIRGLLGPGVAGSTRFDPQAKALGEWLRARLVDIPEGTR